MIINFGNMKIHFLSVGKAHESHVKEGTEMFTKRISNYFPVHWIILPMGKNAGILSEAELKIKEAEGIFNLLKKDDFLVLLDETGTQLKSEELASFLQQRANESTRNLIFLIGGAYGVSKELLQRADYTWSLSKLVFPHQLVRMLLAEQIYRACSILKNEKYHHS